MIGFKMTDRALIMLLPDTNLKLTYFTVFVSFL